MIKKKLLISNFLVIVILLLLLCCFMLSACFTVAFADTAQSTSNYLDYVLEFLGDRDILETKIIGDGGNNEFLLVEMSPSGYAIFAVDDTQYSFVEGAKEANSPFFKYINEALVYLGPMSYFIDKGNYYFNIMTEECVDKEDVETTEYDFLSQQRVMRSAPALFSMENQPLPDKTYNENGYTFIKDAEYFKKSYYFPENLNNDCGIVALFLLLGYFDTCKNDAFINSNDGFISNGSYSALSKSIAFAPKTTDSLKEHLKTYGHRLLLPGDNFAMAEKELKATIQDYIKNKCPSLSSNCVHYSGSIINTHTNPRKLINGGIPVVLVIINYERPTDSQKEKEGGHCVIAYGYKDDTFVTHFGWEDYPEVYLSKYTAYAYYALEYNGGTRSF
ncbi:MAG: hypothetical protein K2O35_06495 [Clostridia bacterium]|nr:hypothetical protein [Clostridia bacterium]